MGERAGFVREAVAVVTAGLVEAEVSAVIGAERGELSPERQTYRNGCGPGLWGTRLGELTVSRKREGYWCFPSFLEPRRPCEQAVVACVVGACVNGVWPGRVDRLVQLGIHGVSKARVLALHSGLDRRVGAFRRWPAGGRVPRSCGSTPSTRRSGIEGMPPARLWLSPTPCTPRSRRDRGRGVPARVPARAALPRPPRRASLCQRPPAGPQQSDRNGSSAARGSAAPSTSSATDKTAADAPSAASSPPARGRRSTPPTHQRRRQSSAKRSNASAIHYPRSPHPSQKQRTTSRPPTSSPAARRPKPRSTNPHSESTAKLAAEPTPPASPPTTAPALRPAAASRTEHNDQ